MQRSRAPIVLGYFFHMDRLAAGEFLAKQDIEKLQVGIEGSKYPVVLLRDERSAAVPLLTAYAPQGNLELFTKVAPSSGYFTIRSDPDGVIRSMPLVIRSGEDLYPPLSLLSAWHYLGKPRLAVRVGPTGVEGVQLGDNFVPTDELGQMLINYRGPPNMFAHYSVSDILAGRLKRVPSRTGSCWSASPPWASTTSGPRPSLPSFRASRSMRMRSTTSLPATSCHDRSGRGRSTSWPSSCSGCWSASPCPGMSAIGALALAAVLAGAYVAFAHWLFVGTRVWLNIVYPAIALAGTYTVLTVYRYLTEERERKKVKDAFKHYVSGEVIEDMLADPDHLRLGGDEKVLTVLFNDIVGFSTVSEQFPPSGVIAILSDYYTRMTEQVLANRGTLTNYIGDELDGDLRRPGRLPGPRQVRVRGGAGDAGPARGVGRRVRPARPPGPACAHRDQHRHHARGERGSTYRFAYTVLGDPVNLTSRLEQLNRTYGTEIMLGEQTANLVAGAFVLRDLDLVKVKGRAQQLRVFELVGRPQMPLPPGQEQMLRMYADALAAYRQRRWAEAADMFRRCMALWPEDGPSRLMSERCDLYLTTSPPEDWDGAFAHQSK
ncbi:MAG: adenylate/guanylate cyclase domain-containing protein [Chromatiales bacterium]|nr:adenylate/guanylate cyclase domain-containing protein [Chromatiales bacterium]